MLLLAVMLLVVGLPFVGSMAATRSVSRSRRPVVADSLGAILYFAAATVGLLMLGQKMGMGRPFPWIMAALIGGCLGAAWAAWRLTRRWLVPILTVALTVASAFVFIWIESRTHGPWYIQSEFAAFAFSLVGAAAPWHLGIVAMLLAWARAARRRGGRNSDGRCVNCGYDLAGLASGTCPECGQAVVRG